MDYQWQVASITHCGNVRKINEDSIYTSSAPLLTVVADGMGGHAAGDLASQMLVKKLAALTLEPRLEPAATQVHDAIIASNREIIAYSKQHLDGSTMGSTVVTLISRGSRGHCLWAGDSRLYSLSGRKLQQLTEDHSYVAELVRTGKLAPEDAINHPSSNIITRTVGVDDQLKLDQVHFDIADQDTFLLCSDGLYNEVSDDEILRAMSQLDINQSANTLLNLCLQRAARDNVSVIIARAHRNLPGQDEATLTYFPG